VATKWDPVPIWFVSLAWFSVMNPCKLAMNPSKLAMNPCKLAMNPCKLAYKCETVKNSGCDHVNYQHFLAKVQSKKLPNRKKYHFFSPLITI